MSAEPAKATIDGREVDVHGQSILLAACQLGIAIPALCHGDGLQAEGGCRMCLVQTDERGRLQAACHTVLRPGMRVVTENERLVQLRHDVLSLILSTHPEGRFTADVAGNEIERLMAELCLSRSEFGHHASASAVSAVDRSHPYMRFDPSLCITCRRCLHACEEVQGQFVYGVEGRGAGTHLIFGPGERFADSACTACGACVDQCPSGAISDIDRNDRRAVTTQTDSVCGYCGVGCRVRIETADGGVEAIAGVPEAAVNHGHLCAKGRYAHGYQNHVDRLTKPLLREGGELRPVSWPVAIDWLARRFEEIRRQHGPDSIGAIASSRSTNEAAYLLQKFMRSVIGSNNVDCCARVCHSSTAAALSMSTGIAAATASYSDIERARCIIVAGANPTEAHPVIGARIKQAALNGARLLVIDPRTIELAGFAELHLQLRPGTNVVLFNAIARALIDMDGIDRAYIDARTDGFAELAEFMRTTSIDQAAAISGVSAANIRQAAAILKAAGPVLFVHGLGLSELTQGTASVLTLTNLGMLTGSIGRPGAGMLPLRGQNNVQGAADMGAAPDKTVGNTPVSDPSVRERLGRLWNAALPATHGKTIPEMLAAVESGSLKAMWIQGEDIAQSECEEDRVVRALEKMELVVVQDLFFCESARYAHLVLPAAAVLEQSGTFTNGERRIQLVHAAVKPIGEARSDWEVVRDVAIAMGHAWNYADPSQVMDEIALAAPASFGGVSYDRLIGDGLQWPCPDRTHPGTATVHADGFVRGRGVLACVDYEPNPEHATDSYPLTLITGRVLQHYNVGTMTRRTPNRDLVSADVLQINAQDAAAMHICEGGNVHVESRWGQVQVPAHVSPSVPQGVVFLSFHFAQSHTNRLLGPHLDPVSRCPNFKVTAVRARPVVDSPK